MTNNYNIAIIGATGTVGEVFLELLAERQFPVGELYAVASENSAGKRLMFNGHSVTVQNIAEFDFSNVDFAFFSAGREVSEIYAPAAAKAGCVVIDNTSQFRYDDDIPLVIPEVNPEALLDYQEHNIIANPNCSTIQMLVALKPIHDAAKITRINVATYQAVSGAGKKAIEELARQTADLLNGQDASVAAFSQQIAFNVLPDIDARQENGFTREEMKMLWETRKIFNDPEIVVNATAVRVPVFYGHSEAIHIETAEPVDAGWARDMLAQTPGIVVVDDGTDYPTAINHAAQEDAVFVGRIRNAIDQANGLNLWVVSDNIRKGAALNAIQIAELIIHHGEQTLH